jgi:replicative DNA helicase
MTDMAPHDERAEMALLASLLQVPTTIGEVAAELTPADFFLVRHEYLYDALCRMATRGDFITRHGLQREMEAAGHWDDLYTHYLDVELPAVDCEPFKAEAYARTIKRTAIRRQLLNHLSEIARRAYDDSEELTDVLNHAQEVIYSFEAPGHKAEVKCFADVISRYDDRVSEIRQAGVDPALPTPFPDLDRIIYGGEGGDFIVVAAPTSGGKSLFLWQWATFLARQKPHMRNPYKILFFSMEMPDEQLTKRSVAQDAGISTSRQRVMTDEDYRRFVGWMGKAVDQYRNLWLVDIPKVNVPRIAALARKHRARYGLDAIFIDYLQLIDNSDAVNAGNRTRELEHTSQALLDLAIAMDLPIITAAQLRRPPNSSPDWKPTVNDLRWGGIEQAANKVLLINPTIDINAVDDPDSLPPLIPVNINVGKHRNGPKSPPDVGLGWDRERIMFKPLVLP